PSSAMIIRCHATSGIWRPMCCTPVMTAPRRSSARPSWVSPSTPLFSAEASMQPNPLTAPGRIKQNGMLPGLSDRVATLTLLFLVPDVIAGALLPESAWGIAVDIELLVYLLLQLPTLRWLPALSLGCAQIGRAHV